MKTVIKKIIPFILILILIIGSVVLSCSIKQKTISLNTGISPDGKVFTNRVMQEITKVIAINLEDRSRIKEFSPELYSYNPETTELIFLQENDKDIGFIVEGKPVQPATFVLTDLDTNVGPVFVFFNDGVAIQNDDYIINTETKTLTFNENLNLEANPYVITWQSYYGMSTIGEQTKEIEDLYSKSQAVWVTDLIRSEIKKQTQTPEVVIENNSAYIRMRSISEEEKQKTIDLLPVTQVKARIKTSAKKLSKEVGFKVSFTEEVKDENLSWKVSVPLLIETSVQGETTKSIELFYYEVSNPEPLILTLSKDAEDENLEWQISEETLAYTIPVIKRTAYAVIQNQSDSSSAENYSAEKYCYYSWKIDDVTYQTNTTENNSINAERFIKAIVNK